jgi:hypothetical protein
LNGLRTPQNGDLLSQRKSQTAYVCESTLRALAFFASLHLTIFERPEVAPKRRFVESAKKPDRFCMHMTARPGFFAFVHLAIFEGPANFEFSARWPAFSTRLAICHFGGSD